MVKKIDIEKRREDIEKLNINYKKNLSYFQDIYEKYLINTEKKTLGIEVGSDFDTINTKLNKIEGQLDGNRTDFVNIKNELQQGMNKLSAEIEDKNKELNKLTKENKELKQKIFLLTDRKQGSDGMIYDQKELYNQHNLGNWIIIILMSGLFYKVVKPKITSENMNEIKTRGTSAMEALKM
jgi:predicted  nucleic acid-binding Zn-ribbon protein